MAIGTIIPAFTTPIWQHIWPNCAVTNDGLKELVLERAQPQKSGRRSTVGGWQSENDLLNWGGPHVAQLIEWIQAGFRALTEATGGTEDAQKGRFMTAAWANMLHKGGYNRVHGHYGFIWSGIYYVDPGDRPPPDHEFSGMLEFVDPRTAASAMYVPGNPFRDGGYVAPQAGQMLIFPAWLTHHVHPYLGERPRISIAFNTAFKSLKELNDPTEEWRKLGRSLGV